MIEQQALARARALLAADLTRFEARLAAALEPQRAYLGPTEDTLYGGGKRLRPVMLLLAARAVRPGLEALPAKAFQAAVALEMLHVATLVHDDIVDEAASRRGAPSVHRERGAKVALLLGDLQFVQAIRCFAGAVETPADLGLVQLVLDVGFQICCGELDELATDARLPLAALRARYLRTIERKTAVLFGLALEVGASLVGARTSEVEPLGRAGRAFGRAFQLMDDLRDLAGGDEGKPRLADLRQGRLTLPIIDALEELGDGAALRRVLDGERDDEALLRAARREVVGSRGWVTAYAEARREALEAAAALGALADTPHGGALRALALELVDGAPAGEPWAQEAR